MNLKRLSLALVTLLCAAGLGAQDFHINSSGYFNKDGVDVMAFNDFYPEGHQGGISVLMNGHRVASNGDIRPDFPELLVFPFLWQQVEYVMGGGSSHYMFLVLAAKDLLKN